MEGLSPLYLIALGFAGGVSTTLLILIAFSLWKDKKASLHIHDYLGEMSGPHEDR